MRHSIRWRLSVYQISVISLAMMAVAVLGQQSIHEYYVKRLEQHLFHQASLVRRVLLAEIDAGLDADPTRRLIAQLGEATTARLTLVDPAGNIVADSQPTVGTPTNLSVRPEIATLLHSRLPSEGQFERAIRADGMHVAIPVFQEQQLLGLVRVSLPLADLHQQLRGLRTLLLGTVLLTTILAVAITLFVTGSITEPIREVTEAAQRMAAGDLTRRVIANPDDEIGQLTRSFNTMAARIQDMMGELDGERRKMAQVFTQMADGLILTDASARITMLNPAAEGILGRSANEVLGKSLREVTDMPELVTLVSDVLESGRERREELLRQNADLQALDIYAARLAERPDWPVGVLLVLHDWTEVWRTERMRVEFIANASHELRTPIAAVKMMVETLLEGARDDAAVRERFLSMVAREADRLSALVSDLLDLSRMEAGQWPLETEAVSVREVAEHTLAKFAMVAEERGQRFSGKCPADLWVQADRRALTQILTNLVENATKYTPEGGEIWFSASKEGERVRLQVRDTGIGIPPEHIARVFERFYRVDKARSRQQGGTGLGLAIVQHLVEAQGGTVEVQSEVGKGSLFTVTLPAATGKPA